MLSWTLAWTGLVFGGCGSDPTPTSADLAAQASDITSTDTPAPADTSAADVALADAASVECLSAADCAAPANPCLVAQCSAGKCTEAPAVTGVCEDGDPCTVADHCSSGQCVPGLDVCACHSDAECPDDGNACNGKPICDTAILPHVCRVPLETVPNCSSDADSECSKNACNSETGACGMAAVEHTLLMCSASGCVRVMTTALMAAGVCDDGNPCTAGDVCKGGQCKAGLDVCNCSSDADCPDDGNLCNGVAYCDKAKLPWSCHLKPFSKVVCSTGGDSACLRNVCDPTKGECSLQPSENLTWTCADGNCAWAVLPPGSPTSSVACSDGNACTSGDFCASGACKAGQESCSCSSDADCAAQEDGDVCNGTLFCNKATGACQLNPATVIQCPTADDTACQKNVCYPKTGVCQPASVEKTTQVCDGNVCTWHLLPPGSPSPGSVWCDDGNPCTQGEACIAGQCAGGTNTCACKSDADCKGLDDGDLCNGVMYCDKAKLTCVLNPASVKPCPTVGDTACQKNACQPLTGLCSATPVGKVKQACVALPDSSTVCVIEVKADAETQGIVCDDGDPCTAGEVCEAGACTGGKKTCTCKTDSDCAGLEDGDACNGTLYCNKQTGDCAWNPATVVSCPSAADTVCLKNACDPSSGQCVAKAVELTKKVCDVQSGCRLEVSLAGSPTSTCEDGDPCTKGDVCGAGQCQSGVFVCECASSADCAKKDDGNLCNGVAFCDKSVAGSPTCAANPASVVVCPATGELCVGNTCDPATGKCGKVAANEKKSCDDGTLCTTADQCTGGQCLGTAIDCNDASACTNDSCSPQTGCVHVGSNCDDGNGCTADLCDAKSGLCVHDATSLTAKACSDGDPCTLSDSCQAGTCTSGAPVICPATSKPCTVPVCVAQPGATYQCVTALAKDGAACGDGKACTLDATCQAGTCKPGTVERLGFAQLDDPTLANLRWTTATPTDDGGLWAGGMTWSGTPAGTNIGAGSYWIGHLSAAAKPTGKVLMTTMFGSIPDRNWLTLSATGDGGVLVAGTVATPNGSGGNLPQKPFISKVTAAGVQWTKLYGVTAEIEFCTAASLSDGGTSWLAGSRTVGGIAKLMIIQVAPTWQTVWTKLYDVGSTSAEVSRVQARPGGGLVVFGWRNDPGGAMPFAVAVDASGTLVWVNSYPTSDSTWTGRTFQGAAATSDGAWLVVGDERSGTNRRGWWGEITSKGELVWNESSGNPGRWMDIQSDGLDHFAVAGSYQPVGATAPVAWLQGLDRRGNGQWAAQQASADIWPGVATAKLGGWWPVGGQDAPGAAGWIGLSQRVDPWGHASCNEAGVCATAQASDCDDGNTCTVDSCDASKGCKVTAVEKLRCQPTDSCSGMGSCTQGKCPQTDQGRLYSAAIHGGGTTFYAAATQANGSTLVGGTTAGPKAVLVRLDDAGHEVWSDVLMLGPAGSLDYAYVHSIVPTPDGGFFVGASGRLGSMNYDGNVGGPERYRRLRKYSASNVITFDEWSGDDYPNNANNQKEGDDVVDEGDGTYIWLSREGDKPNATKLNQVGTYLYSVAPYIPPYDGTGITNYAWDLRGAAAPNAQTWVGGFRRSADTRYGWLSKLSSNGTILFQKDSVQIMTGWTGAYIRDMEPAPNGGVYVLFRMVNPAGAMTPRLARYDANGNGNWQIDLGDDAYYNAWALVGRSDGDVWVVSEAQKNGYSIPCIDVRNPSALRRYRFFLPGSGSLFAATTAGWGDIVGAGRIADFSNGLVIRATAWGQTGCAAAGACASKAPVTCDDGIACTIDLCAPSTGACSHTNLPSCL